MAGLYLHFYHDRLLVWEARTLAERRQDIRDNKRFSERETRLRLLKRVRGKLPNELVVVLRGWPDWCCEYQDALRKYRREIEALHKKECPRCPWNGRTIFPKKKRRI